jgi:phenylpyruvate tautomerase PptA (4-oxalocrotonate tautomerase family)
MPLVTITLHEGVHSAAEKRAIADGVHKALVSTGVPEADRFQRIFEMKPEHFIYDPTYPSLEKPRTQKFVVIEILFSVGRSVKVKRGLLKTLIEHLQQNPKLDPNDVMVVFKETTWENWAFAGGVQIHI